MKVRTKIILFFSIGVLVPLIAGLVFVGLMVNTEFSKLTFDLAQQLTERSSLELSSYFSNRMSEISIYGRNPIIESLDWDQAGDYLREEVAQEAIPYEKILIALPNGTYYITNKEGNPVYGGLQTANNDDPEAELLTLKARAYWQEIFSKNEDSYIGEPVISASNGVIQNMVTSAIKNESGDTIGMVAGSITYEELKGKFEQIEESIVQTFDGQGNFFLLSNSGLYAYHWEADQMIHLDNGQIIVPNVMDSTDSGFLGVAQKMLNAESGIQLINNPVDGVSSYIFYTSLEGYNGSLAMILPEEYITNKYRLIKLVMIIFGILIFGVIFFIGVFLSRMIRKPLEKTIFALEELSSGEGDLTLRMPVVGKNEFSDLAEGFNGFIEQLQKMVTSIRDAGQHLEIGGIDLTSNITETAAASTQISENIKGVRNQIEHQNSSLAESSSGVEEITRNITSLTEAVESQASSVEESSASIKQMISQINSVTHNMKKIGIQFHALESSSKEGSEKLTIVNESIKQIALQSESLQDANTIISGIASQTNLLAMNAAIEAAHAGEAGKGFSVVSDEIRKLAELSAEQSKQIGAELNLIKTVIDEVVVSSLDAEQSFDEVQGQIKEVSQLEAEVTMAMEEQSQASREILDALGTMNAMTSVVRDGSLEMDKGGKMVLVEMSQLNKISSEVFHGINEASMGVEEINQSMNNASDLGLKNKESIDLLLTETNRFKL